MNKYSLWRDECSCSESLLEDIAHEFAKELRPGARVFLEGPMGAGKTTFAKALLAGLGVSLPAEGSPTFALAHEYPWGSGPDEVIHLDLYRLKSEEELEDAGISSYFWERHALVLVEWISLFPEFQQAVLRSAHLGSQSPVWTVWVVQLAFHSDNPEKRSVHIKRWAGPAEPKKT